MKKLHVLLLLFIMTGGLYAQTFTNYTTANSLLCNDTVFSIAFDAQGNKWFGTKNGVSNFDGTDWKTYDTTHGLADNHVTCITMDTSGNKWFGTNKGISEFTDSSWTNYISPGSYTCIKTDSANNIWLTSWPLDDLGLPMSGTVISRFNGTDWEKLDHSDEPYYSIAIDSLDNKWFSTPGIVIKYDGVTWDTYYFGVGETRAIVFDRNGILWTSDAKKFDGNNFVDILENGMLGDFYFEGSSLAIDSKNNKWFGTDTIGIWKYDDITWTNYTTENGLVSNHIFSAAIDAEGNIWFGTTGGISELVNDEVTQLKQSEIIDVNLYPLPVIDKLTVSFSKPISPTTIEVFSIDGIKLCSLPVYDSIMMLDMSNYPAGTYFVRINTLNGVMTKKIFKGTH